MNKKKIKPSSIVLFLVCCAVAVAMIMPFLWMVSASFKLRNEIFSRPIQWIPQTFHKDNYETILEKIPFSTYKDESKSHIHHQDTRPRITSSGHRTM